MPRYVIICRERQHDQNTVNVPGNITSLNYWNDSEDGMDQTLANEIRKHLEGSNDRALIRDTLQTAGYPNLWWAPNLTGIAPDAELWGDSMSKLFGVFDLDQHGKQVQVWDDTKRSLASVLAAWQGSIDIVCFFAA